MKKKRPIIDLDRDPHFLLFSVVLSVASIAILMKSFSFIVDENPRTLGLFAQKGIIADPLPTEAPQKIQTTLPTNTPPTTAPTQILNIASPIPSPTVAQAIPTTSTQISQPTPIPVPTISVSLPTTDLPPSEVQVKDNTEIIVIADPKVEIVVTKESNNPNLDIIAIVDQKPTDTLVQNPVNTVPEIIAQTAPTIIPVATPTLVPIPTINQNHIITVTDDSSDSFKAIATVVNTTQDVISIPSKLFSENSFLNNTNDESQTVTGDSIETVLAKLTVNGNPRKAVVIDDPNSQILNTNLTARYKIDLVPLEEKAVGLRRNNTTAIIEDSAATPLHINIAQSNITIGDIPLLFMPDTIKDRLDELTYSSAQNQSNMKIRQMGGDNVYVVEAVSTQHFLGFIPVEIKTHVAVSGTTSIILSARQSLFNKVMDVASVAVL